MAYTSIHPGEIWIDTNGRQIQAHGFSVFYDENDKCWYWYGENKERTTGGPFNKIWTYGIRCYSSKDFYNWTDEGLIIPPSDDMSNPLHPTYCIDRPHIIYCEKTGKCEALREGEHSYGEILPSPAMSGFQSSGRMGIR